MAPEANPPIVAPASTRRDRPWLLPSNHKLRNVISLSLRNLNLEHASSGRKRGKTIDDDALPHTLKSPAKIVALREGRPLEHSRSSTDLRSVAEEDAVVDTPDAREAKGSNVPRPQKGAERTPPRPPFIKMRRRSTLEWANATPQRRQERLERVTSERMADVFFSLHVQGIKEPIYVSEVVSQTMNPSFRQIDFSTCGPAITRLSLVTVRVWVKSARFEHWKQLMELCLNLSSLQYLGKSLDQFHFPLPQNAVIFHLTDGVYTSFTSLADVGPPPTAFPTKSTTSRTLPSASFDALLRLAKLDDSIQDALATRDELAADLEALLIANKKALLDRDSVAEAQDRLKTIEYAGKTVRKQLEKAHKQQDERRSALSTRRQFMARDLELRANLNEQMQNIRPELPGMQDEREVKKHAIQNQRRRVCEDLQKSYPINTIPKKSLEFKVRNLALPNSDELDQESPETVAAALGDVTQIIHMLSIYLSQPLLYPVDFRGSTSTIEDPISLLKSNASTTERYKDDKSLRTYPLFSKGVPRFRCEYAVFLLNKNIQMLLETVYNVRVLDIRQTLPNLKYLLYVATAGEGELPARKAGGVRGLLRAKPGGSTPVLSRQGSDASTNSALSGLLWHGGTVNANGKPKGAVESLKKNIGPLAGGGRKRS